MASLKADVEAIVHRLTTDHGCSAKLSKNGHWRVSRRTPSDQRVIRNIKSDVRRYLGVNL
jgi:hypothetical protein